MPTVPRRILGFARDEVGDWTAALDCGHRRHVRHRPPLSSYPWIEDPEQRERHVGERIECGRCARREWPEGVEPYRATKQFDERDLPAGLLADHQTRAGVWGRLVVVEGTLELCFAAPLDERVRVSAGEWAAIPPELTHHVELDGAVRFYVEFCRRD